MQKHYIYINRLDLVRPEETFKAALCFGFFIQMTDYEATIPYLHARERDYYNTLKFEKRIKSYLMGRFVAKQAVAALSGENNLSDIFIQPGIFTQPIVVSNQRNIQVSITHCDDFGAALAFPEAHPMGIDIEKIQLKNREALERQITESEKERINCLPASYNTGLTLLWTVKEALSKVLKTGLMTPFEVFEISKIELYDNYQISYFKNFAQYKAISFTIGNNYLCSMVHPFKTKLDFDIEALRVNFDFIEAI
jgi:4'-phosphopantetheinyl transferase